MAHAAPSLSVAPSHPSLAALPGNRGEARPWSARRARPWARRPRRIPRLAALLGVLAAFLVSWGGAARAASLTLEQRKEISVAVREFRKRDTTPERRKELVDTLLAYKEDGAKKLMPVLERSFEDALEDYEKDLYDAAEEFYEDRLPKGKSERKDREEEIEKLRKTLAGLRAGNLTKDQTVKIGEPALKRLAELLLIQSSQVLEAQEELKAKRAEVLEYAGYLEATRPLAPTPKKRSRRRGKDEAEEEAKPAPITARLETMEMMAALSPIAEERDLKTLEYNLSVADQIDALESVGIMDLNIMRILLGIPAMRVDVKLCAASRDHSNDMRTKGFFSHDSPVAGKAHFTQRAKNFGTSARGENIAYGSPCPQKTNMQWFHSPGHHKNMLNDNYKAMGLGRSETHWTQMFR